MTTNATAQELRLLMGEAGLSAATLAELVEASSEEVAAWIDGSRQAPPGLRRFLTNYIELKILSAGVECPLPRR